MVSSVRRARGDFVDARVDAALNSESQSEFELVDGVHQAE